MTAPGRLPPHGWARRQTHPFDPERPPVTGNHRAIHTVAIIDHKVVESGCDQQLITTATMCVRVLNWNDTSGNL